VEASTPTRAYFAREVAKWKAVIEKGGITTQ
jgi:hypothetical protein